MCQLDKQCKMYFYLSPIIATNYATVKSLKATIVVE